MSIFSIPHIIYPPHTSKAIKELYEIDLTNNLIRSRKAALRLEKARSKKKAKNSRVKTICLISGLIIASPVLFILGAAFATENTSPISSLVYFAPTVSPPQVVNLDSRTATSTQRSSEFSFSREAEQSLSAGISQAAFDRGQRQAAYELSQRGISYSGVGSEIREDSGPSISNSAHHVQNQSLGEGFCGLHSPNPRATPLATTPRQASQGSIARPTIGINQPQLRQQQGCFSFCNSLCKGNPRNFQNLPTISNNQPIGSDLVAARGFRLPLAEIAEIAKKMVKLERIRLLSEVCCHEVQKTGNYVMSIAMTVPIETPRFTSTEDVRSQAVVSQTTTQQGLTPQGRRVEVNFPFKGGGLYDIQEASGSPLDKYSKIPFSYLNAVRFERAFNAACSSQEGVPLLFGPGISVTDCVITLEKVSRENGTLCLS